MSNILYHLTIENLIHNMQQTQCLRYKWTDIWIDGRWTDEG